MNNECTNCKHCRMRRTQVWCKLDKETKPAMSYNCDRWEPGQQWELLGADGKPVSNLPK